MLLYEWVIHRKVKWNCHSFSKRFIVVGVVMVPEAGLGTLRVRHEYTSKYTHRELNVDNLPISMFLWRWEETRKRGGNPYGQISSCYSAVRLSAIDWWPVLGLGSAFPWLWFINRIDHGWMHYFIMRTLLVTPLYFFLEKTLTSHLQQKKS